MGFATAGELVREGRAELIIGRDAAKLAAAKGALNREGSGQVETMAGDLYDPTSVDAMIERIDAEPRHIDQLVNAAGYFFPKSFLDHSRSDYDRYLELNRSTFFLTQAVARNMARHGGGAIVNIGSMWAKQAIKATPSSA